MPRTILGLAIVGALFTALSIFITFLPETKWIFDGKIGIELLFNSLVVAAIVLVTYSIYLKSHSKSFDMRRADLLAYIMIAGMMGIQLNFMFPLETSSIWSGHQTVAAVVSVLGLALALGLGIYGIKKGLRSPMLIGSVSCGVVAGLMLTDLVSLSSGWGHKVPGQLREDIIGLVVADAATLVQAICLGILICIWGGFVVHENKPPYKPHGEIPYILVILAGFMMVCLSILFNWIGITGLQQLSLYTITGLSMAIFAATVIDVARPWEQSYLSIYPHQQK